MSHKAAETTCNINNAFGPGTANECTVQWWFEKFCKGEESLEDEVCSGQPLEGDKVISVSDSESEIILTRLRHIFINQNRNYYNQHTFADEKKLFVLIA